MRLAKILLLLLWMMSVVLIWTHWEGERQERLAESNMMLATTYQASVTMYRLAAEILIADVVKRPEVLSVFAEGVSSQGAARDIARGKLYRTLAPAYAHLTEQGIHQLQFHTADGYSFLRFHAPEKFGDPLFDIRPTVRLANTEKRNTFGFEVGRINSGFRYVFPLFYEAKHLGSVEASITFRMLSAAMSSIDPGHEYLLVLRRAAVERALLQERRSLFAASSLNDEFLVEDPGLHLPDSPPAVSLPVQKLNTLLGANAEVSFRMRAGQPFALALQLEGNGWAVAFEPIKDLSGSAVAYVISYAPAPFLADQRLERTFALAAVTLAFAGIFGLTWRLLQAHRTLHQEKQQLQIVTDTIADGLFVMDFHGQIVRINPAFTEILGYREDDIVGSVGHNRFHRHRDGHGRLAAEDCPIIAATRKGEDYSGEELFLHKDGRLLTVEVFCKPVMQHAQLQGSVTAFRDISERKETEERLKEADRVKSEFLANVSHEFRTPMTIFMGAIEHLQTIDRDAEHQELLEMADNASQRLYTLINDILDFSKLEAQRMELEREAVNVQECLGEVVALMSLKAQEKGLALDCAVAPGVPALVEGDRYRLGQVLINLVGNAIKFTDRGEVKLFVKCHDDMLEFSVSDTGIGIPEEKLGNIFEIFTQVDGASTRRHSGTGLGLTISRRLVELMGGRISVYSQLGQGSVFTFTLPMKSPPPSDR